MNDLFSLAGRTALITGGSRGIGEMIAEGFLRAGAKVYISSRKPAACIETAERLSVHGVCEPLPADVSNVEGVRDLVRRYGEKESALDVLVNNAGAVWGAGFSAFPEAGWDKVLDLNLKSPFFLTQALHELLKAAASTGRPSKVINIASIDGLSVAPTDTYSYAASKAGLIHLTKQMALALARDNIMVSAIAPGAFSSEMNKDARDNPDDVAGKIPAGRIGRSSDMAGAAVFLASSAGDYVVGSTLTVDGGAAFARLAIG
jgi:NAD(P)-dependent dehydrogenase (short-subunit alcohol dehydrogenase family)